MFKECLHKRTDHSIRCVIPYVQIKSCWKSCLWLSLSSQIFFQMVKWQPLYQSCFDDSSDGWPLNLISYFRRILIIASAIVYQIRYPLFPMKSGHLWLPSSQQNFQDGGLYPLYHPGPTCMWDRRFAQRSSRLVWLLPYSVLLNLLEGALAAW